MGFSPGGAVPLCCIHICTAGKGAFLSTGPSEHGYTFSLSQARKGIHNHCPISMGIGLARSVIARVSISHLLSDDKNPVNRNTTLLTDPILTVPSLVTLNMGS